MFHRIAIFPIPTICYLNGPALGGGVGLALGCDIRISSSPSNYLALTEVRRGLVPALISPSIVAALGRSMAIEMMTTGARITTDRLYSLGIFHAVVGQPSMTPRFQEAATIDLICKPAEVRSSIVFIEQPHSHGLTKRMETLFLPFLNKCFP
jgi:methylglutaconyl-CoA hydratase